MCLCALMDTVREVNANLWDEPLLTTAMCASASSFRRWRTGLRGKVK
jgi:hypothetical protein